MPLRTIPSRLVLLLASAVALACSSGAEPRSCETIADCPAASRCRQRICVADEPPVARVAGPASAVERALVTFDASASTDTDEEDQVSGWSWSLRPITANCTAPAVDAATKVVKVRFPCPGRWAVDLVVRDELLVESDVASIEVEVAPNPGEPLVSIAEDVSVPHRCAGEPLRCTPVDPKAGEALSFRADVRASDVEPDSYVFTWTLEPPPGLPLGADRRATLEQVDDGDGSALVARIETDGTAIAGQWAFTGTARDAGGVIGSATRVVTITNEAPVIVLELPETVAHRYDAGGRFIASGELPLTVVDPEGDPIQRDEPIARALNAGPASEFEVRDLGSAVRYWIEVPYAAPADALYLIGGPGLTRELELTVRDVNGAATKRVAPIVVGNRPPREKTHVDARSVDHWYDAATGRYRATATLSTFVDDDGDPLVQADSTGSSVCASFTISGAGLATVDCALEFKGSPATSLFAAPHVVALNVADPFAAAPAAYGTVEIGNRPPRIDAAAYSFDTTCTTNPDSCCEFEDGRCVVRERTVAGGTFSMSPPVTDPDGDPLLVDVSTCGSVTPGSATCVGEACGPFQVTTCELEICTGNGGEFGVEVSATDGSLTATTVMNVGWTCQ